MTSMPTQIYSEWYCTNIVYNKINAFDTLTFPICIYLYLFRRYLLISNQLPPQPYTVTEALVLRPPTRRPRVHHRVNPYLGARCKSAIVQPLQKKRKMDLNDPASYRPISNLSLLHILYRDHTIIEVRCKTSQPPVITLITMRQLSPFSHTNKLITESFTYKFWAAINRVQ